MAGVAAAILIGLGTQVAPLFDVPTGMVPSAAFTQQTYTYDATAETVNDTDRNLTLGVDGSRDRLDFGVVPLNVTVRKFLNFHSDRPIRVRFAATGMIADRLELPARRTVQGGQEFAVAFRSPTPGNYTGTVRIDMLAATHPAARRLLTVVP